MRYYAGEKFSWNISKDNTTGNYYQLMPAINRSVALSKYRDGYRDSYNSPVTIPIEEQFHMD